MPETELQTGIDIEDRRGDEFGRRARRGGRCRRRRERASDSDAAPMYGESRRRDTAEKRRPQRAKHGQSRASLMVVVATQTGRSSGGCVLVVGCRQIVVKGRLPSRARTAAARLPPSRATLPSTTTTSTIRPHPRPSWPRKSPRDTSPSRSATTAVRLKRPSPLRPSLVCQADLIFVRVVSHCSSSAIACLLPIRA